MVRVSRANEIKINERIPHARIGSSFTVKVKRTVSESTTPRAMQCWQKRAMKSS